MSARRVIMMIEDKVNGKYYAIKRTISEQELSSAVYKGGLLQHVYQVLEGALDNEIQAARVKANA